MKHGSEKDERRHDGTGVGFLLQGGVDIALAMAFGDEPGLIRAIVTMVAVIAVAIAGRLVGWLRRQVARSIRTGAMARGKHAADRPGTRHAGRGRLRRRP